MLNRSWPTADRTLVLPTMALLKGGYEAEEEEAPATVRASLVQVRRT